MVVETLGDRLKALLKQKGVSQRRLSLDTGISEAQICRYLSGARHPQGKALLTLANYFGVSTDALLGHENKSSSPYERLKEAIEKEKDSLTPDETIKLITLLTRKN